MIFIGIDGCKDGWFCVTLDEEDNWSYRIIPDAQSLGRYISQANSVFIDIPIGLLDTGTDERQCDKQGRKLLRPKRSSSVFPAPARQTLQAVSYEDAQLINRNSNGRGLSQQSWNIVPKIREIDDLMLSQTSLRGVMRECHPEICFWALNGKRAMQYNKKKAQGKQERLSILQQYFEPCDELFEQASSQYLRRQLAYDDIIDAMVCAVTSRGGYDNYSTVPVTPEQDAHGLALEMVYWLPQWN
jgi:predicted RNase H-like nuclease